MLLVTEWLCDILLKTFQKGGVTLISTITINYRCITAPPDYSLCESLHTVKQTICRFLGISIYQLPLIDWCFIRICRGHISFSPGLVISPMVGTITELREVAFLELQPHNSEACRFHTFSDPQHIEMIYAETWFRHLKLRGTFIYIQYLTHYYGLRGSQATV